MGAEPYCYFTNYLPDIQDVLDRLREAELAAGRYEPCFHERTGKYLFEIGFMPRNEFPAPGGCHGSVDEVYGVMDEGGTNSILDIVRAVGEPFPVVDNPLMADDTFERMQTSAPASSEELSGLFGTGKPTAEQITDILLATGAGADTDMERIEKRDSFWGQIGRGQSRYVIAYRDGEPSQVFFAGISFD